MAAEQFVNVTYRGLELGRRLRVSQFGPNTAYLEHPTPMPVGTELAMHTDEGFEVGVRVLRVQEQVAGAENPPGMRVAAAALDDQAWAWWSGLVTASDPQIPEPMLGAPVEAEAADAAGAVEVDDAQIEAEAADVAVEDDAPIEAAEVAEAEAEPAELAEAEAEPAELAAEGEDAEGEDTEGEDEQAGGGWRDGSPTEKMSVAEIRELVAGGDEAGAAEAAEADESADRERAGTGSDGSDAEDSGSRGKRRRRGRRRGKNRG